MLFPQPISGTLPTPTRFRLHRPSQAQAETPYAVAPVMPMHRAKGPAFMGRSFSAQLLELGLRYGIEELVSKHDENRNVFYTDNALCRYEQAEGNFTLPYPPALYTRFVA
jgi:hypothetical protein